jgi:hypothetical protein
MHLPLPRGCLQHHSKADATCVVCLTIQLGDLRQHGINLGLRLTHVGGILRNARTDPYSEMGTLLDAIDEALAAVRGEGEP